MPGLAGNAAYTPAHPQQPNDSVSFVHVQDICHGAGLAAPPWTCTSRVFSPHSGWTILETAHRGVAYFQLPLGGRFSLPPEAQNFPYFKAYTPYFDRRSLVDANGSQLGGMRFRFGSIS